MNTTASRKTRILLAVIATLTATLFACTVCLAAPSTAHASSDRSTIGKKLTGTYYKYTSKKTVMTLKLGKKTWVVKIKSGKKAAKVIDRGYYKTWRSESMAGPSSGRPMFATKSYILFDFVKKGKKVTVDGCKHLYNCKSLRYTPGTYYKSKKTAKKHVQKPLDPW